METTYIVNFIQNICKAKSVTPSSEFLVFLKGQNDTLIIKNPIVKKIQTYNEFFCIASILQENLEFLLNLTIDSLDFSKINLNHLSIVLKVSTHIKSLTIRNSHFPLIDMFLTLCDTISINPNILFLNFSYNRLSDAFGNAICKIIENSLSVKELILDNNQFIRIEFGAYLSVSTLEYLSLDHNPLSLLSVVSLLDSCKSNGNIKRISLKGIKFDDEQADFEKVILETIEHSKLLYFGFDFSWENTEYLKKIEKLLINHNKFLIFLDSNFVD